MGRQRGRDRKQDGTPGDEQTPSQGAQSLGDQPEEPGARESRAEEPEAPFGAINWVLAVGGVFLLAFGFIYLSSSNAQADNMPAYVAPYIIIGSYLMVFAAIVLRFGTPPKAGGSHEIQGPQG